MVQNRTDGGLNNFFFLMNFKDSVLSNSSLKDEILCMSYYKCNIKRRWISLLVIIIDMFLRYVYFIIFFH